MKEVYGMKLHIQSCATLALDSAPEMTSVWVARFTHNRSMFDGFAWSWRQSVLNMPWNQVSKAPYLLKVTLVRLISTFPVPCFRIAVRVASRSLGLGVVPRFCRPWKLERNPALWNLLLGYKAGLIYVNLLVVLLAIIACLICLRLCTFLACGISTLTWIRPFISRLPQQNTAKDGLS